MTTEEQLKIDKEKLLKIVSLQSKLIEKKSIESKPDKYDNYIENLNKQLNLSEKVIKNQENEINKNNEILEKLTDPSDNSTPLNNDKLLEEINNILKEKK